jgi:hypothetical protein
VSELYRPRDSRLSAKLAPTFADRECHAVSVTNPYGRILGFLDQSRYFLFQVAPQFVLTRLSGPSGKSTAFLSIAQLHYCAVVATSLPGVGTSAWIRCYLRFHLYYAYCNISLSVLCIMDEVECCNTINLFFFHKLFISNQNYIRFYKLICCESV